MSSAGTSLKMSTSRVPQLQSCCCMCPLGMGTILIAYWQLVVCTVIFVIEIYGLSRSAQFTEPVDRTLVSGTILYIIFSSMYEVIFAIYLLIGIHKKKYHYAKVWCLVQAAYVVVSLFTTIFDIYFRFLDKSISLHILDAFVITALDIYFILVVYSYYRSQKIHPRSNTMSTV